MTKPKYLIGFDVGGTKIEANLIEIGGTFRSPKAKHLSVQTADGKAIEVCVSHARRAPTERQFGYEHIVMTMSDLARGVCADGGIDISAVEGIGVALPGSVEPRTQMMTDGNTMVLVRKDLVGDLLKALQVRIPISASNDANCFALAEALCGAGIEHSKKFNVPVSKQTCLGIILGTGCGGGIVIGGRMLTGRRGGAAEFGHTILFDDGYPCYCGRNGCAEQYLSGPAIEAAFNQRHYAQVEGFPSAQKIFELADALDPVAVAVVKQYQKHLASFLGNLVSIFDPDLIVLGGGVSRQQSIYNGLSQLVAARTFIAEPHVPIYQYSISDSAGAIGAALTTLDSI